MWPLNPFCFARCFLTPQQNGTKLLPVFTCIKRSIFFWELLIPPVGGQSGLEQERRMRSSSSSTATAAAGSAGELDEVPGDMVGLDDLDGLLQPEWLYDLMRCSRFAFLSPSQGAANSTLISNFKVQLPATGHCCDTHKWGCDLEGKCQEYASQLEQCDWLHLCLASSSWKREQQCLAVSYMLRSARDDNW